MSKKIIAQKEEIVIGVDVSDMKHNVVVVNTRGEILKETEMKRPSRKVWSMLLKGLPGCRVTVVYEAGPQGYTLHDAIRDLGHTAVVVAPVKTLGIKTDRRDARRIAREFLSGSARRITVPDEKKRVMRQLLRQRVQIRKDMTRIQNRMNAMMRFHGLIGTLKAVFTKQAHTEVLRFCLNQQEQMYEFLKSKKQELDELLEVVARNEDYRDDVEKLTRIIGIGTLSALEIVLGVADIRAFADAKSFSSYCGLCSGEWSTGNTRRMGHITRRGPGRIRGVLVQCAWTAVRHDPAEKQRYEDLKARIGKKKAIVAIARRLSVKAWRVLNEKETSKAA